MAAGSDPLDGGGGGTVVTVVLGPEVLVLAAVIVAELSTTFFTYGSNVGVVAFDMLGVDSEIDILSVSAAVSDEVTLLFTMVFSSEVTHILSILR